MIDDDFILKYISKYGRVPTEEDKDQVIADLRVEVEELKKQIMTYRREINDITGAFDDNWRS